MGSDHKRKRDEHSSELRVSSFTEEPAVVVGTFFNGFDAPKNVNVDLYKKKNSDQALFHAENDRLDFDGVPCDDLNSDYAIAVYDPVHKSVDLYKAPVLLGSVTSKSKRKLRGPAVRQNKIHMFAQRNALGVAFGTKKAKKAISEKEKNRIDAEKLVDSQTDIVDAVRSTTQSLPTRQELTDNVVNDRPTPVANVDATDVADIYPIENIIEKQELSFIRVGPILNEEDIKKRIELLPYQESEYIAAHLSKIKDESQSTKLQLIYYASLLMGLYRNRRIHNKVALTTQLNDAPEVLIDGLLQRFAILKPGRFGRAKDRGYTIDPHHEDKLLCYLLVTILHINNFIVEVTPLAQELSLKPSRLVGLFKALGAVVKSATVGEAEAFGIPRAAAASYKIASLKVPFKLPQMTRRGKKI